jgi:hypothetical protein
VKEKKDFFVSGFSQRRWTVQDLMKVKKKKRHHVTVSNLGSLAVRSKQHHERSEKISGRKRERKKGSSLTITKGGDGFVVGRSPW